MKHLIDYVRGYLTKNEGNIEPIWNMDDSDFESDFEEGLEIKSDTISVPTPGGHFQPGICFQTKQDFETDDEEEFIETQTTCSDFRRITHPGFEFSDDSDYDNI